jgi:hypothetical protein
MRDPVAESMIMDGYLSKAWDRIYDYMKKKYGENHSNLCENIPEWFNGVISLGYNVPFKAPDIYISSVIDFCLGLSPKEGKRIDSIWDLVNNKTLFEKLKKSLDVIAEGLEYAGIDYYGMLVVVDTYFLTPLVPNPQQFMSTTYSNASSSSIDNDTEYYNQYQVMIAVIILILAPLLAITAKILRKTI